MSRKEGGWLSKSYILNQGCQKGEAQFLERVPIKSKEEK